MPVYIYRVYDHESGPEIYAGRKEGLQLVLDGHRDQITSKSISDTFGGFHVVVDGKENFPFISRNSILVKAGQANEVVIRATRFDPDERIKKEVPALKRNCYFPDENPRQHPMIIHQNYTQTNCLFECKLESVRRQRRADNKTRNTCIPWFYPKENKYIFDLCNPWETTEFQTLLKNVDDNECKYCLPDCKSTKYKMSLSSAPFGNCDQTNLGLSPLCDLSTGKNMMMNPPIWKDVVKGEYEKFNGGTVPDFVKNQKNILKNIRYYASEQETKHLTLRAQHEQNPSYNALEDDITVVNFYFDEPDIIQYLKYLRMTPIDFISKVQSILFKRRNKHILISIIWSLDKN